MKISFKYFYLVSLVTIICTTSCKKKVEVPTGDGTFSCFIDGELFLPAENVSGGAFFQRIGLSVYRQIEYIEVKAKDYENFLLYFMIVDYGEGTYTLSDSDGKYEPILSSLRNNNAILHTTDGKYLSKEGSGTVTITDTTGRELKGVFEFTLYNEHDESDVIQVTDGRFDN